MRPAAGSPGEERADSRASRPDARGFPPKGTDRARATLLERARGVLDANWAGRYSKPSADLYPHQWSWDSCFVAMGYARHAPERAVRELVSILGAQWQNGMVPHIVFNPEIRDYSPGPGFWDVRRSAEAPRHVLTSGLTQPPVHATAVLHVHRNGGPAAGREFLEGVFPRLLAQHRYLYRHRDPEGEGLVYVHHPWESGADDSPAWDAPLARIEPRPENLPEYRRSDIEVLPASERPRRAEYDRYVWLVELCKKADYRDDVIFRESPFLVQDPLFNALLCRANEDLAEIASVLGEDDREMREWRGRTAEAIEAKLWNEVRGLYAAYDLVAGESLPAESAGGFAPLFAGVPSAARARGLVERLESEGFSGPDLFLAPSWDRRHPAFDPVRYWRGPVWINLDWILHRGLSRYGFGAEAEALWRDALTLMERFGFREYYSPYRSEAEGPVGGRGADGMGWSAALCIDFLANGADA